MLLHRTISRISLERILLMPSMRFLITTIIYYKYVPFGQFVSHVAHCVIQLML